jgi:hypothetical protein
MKIVREAICMFEMDCGILNRVQNPDSQLNSVVVMQIRSFFFAGVDTIAKNHKKHERWIDCRSF